MTISVREKPPAQLYCLATTPRGQTHRWAADEPRAENAPSGLAFSDTIPGGFESFGCTLPRKPQQTYQDLERLSDVRAEGVGGELAWQGRLERSPRDSGGQAAVQPAAVGYQAELDDDKTAQEIYVDQDISNWGGASVQRQINLLGSNYSENDATSTVDTTTGAPSLATSFSGSWSATGLPRSEGWYDAGPGCRIGSIYYAWKKNPNVNAPTDANWHWHVHAGDDDTSGADDTGNLNAAGPGTGTLTAGASTRRFGFVEFYYTTGTGLDGVDFTIYWTKLAVYGNHGLTLQGTSDATTAQGLYASDVIADAVSRWAPQLNFTTGSSGTIRPTSFVIPQLSFRDMTTVSEIIRQCLRFGLEDWAVWDDKTFWLYPRGEVGRRWRARIAPTQLQETGPQVDRVWNGVVVVYRDAAGATKTVGPTGSLADSTSDLLIDADPLNPANGVGIHRYATLDMGIFSTAEAATEVGRRFLEESKALDSSGSAQIVGWCEDDHGVMHPAWKVRAGDYISFVDASDTSYRRIVKKDYDHDTRTASIDLDAPPEGMDALLERLSAVLLNAEYGQGPITHTGFPFKQGIGV